MKEPKVSLELAKLLKEKKFKKKVRHLYFQEKLGEDEQLANWNKVGANHISAPTISFLVDYILDKYNVLVVPKPEIINNTIYYNITMFHLGYPAIIEHLYIIKETDKNRALDKGLIILLKRL